MRITHVLAVAAGGAVGTAMRVGVSDLVGDQAFPWATLLVNVIGSGALGYLVVRLLHHAGTAGVGFLAIGVLGAFTTFSAFIAEADALGGDGVAYVAVSIVAGIAAAFAGMEVARR